MAFLRLSDGTLIHSSQIVFPGETRPARALGNWQDVWARIDGPPREGEPMVQDFPHGGPMPAFFDPSTAKFYYGRGPVTDALVNMAIKKLGYGPRTLKWIAEGNLTHDPDRARITARRAIRAEVVRLWRNFVRSPQ